MVPGSKNPFRNVGEKKGDLLGTSEFLPDLRVARAARCFGELE